ncbi:MAG: glycosyltransferase [Chitinophagaceae bacterium]
MKIAAVIILYYVDKDIISNIKTYYNYVDKIFVFDNSETESHIKKNLSKLPKIIFFHDNQNLGIAKRLNQACTLALEEGFDWLLTMDQDSKFSLDAISNYFSCFSQYKNKENVAMFAPKYSRETILSTKECQHNEKEKLEELITAGALLNLSLYKKIDGFDEALFIDAVDFDYCVRAKLCSYSIVEFTNVFLSHELGKQVYRSSIKTLFTVKKKKIIHSPLRCYYIYRNMLYLKKKYENCALQSTHNYKNHVNAHIKNCILYGRNASEIKKFIKLAKKDFGNGRMGKIEQTK